MPKYRVTLERVVRQFCTVDIESETGDPEDCFYTARDKLGETPMESNKLWSGDIEVDFTWNDVRELK